MKCNQSPPVFELVSPCPFPKTITITPLSRWIVIYFFVWRGTAILVILIKQGLKLKKWKSNIFEGIYFFNDITMSIIICKIFHACFWSGNRFQVSMILLSILTDLNCVIPWKVFIFVWSPIYRLLSKHLGTVPCAPNTIWITVIFTLYLFVCSLASSKHLSSHFLSFLLWHVGTAKYSSWQLFFLIKHQLF